MSTPVSTFSMKASFPGGPAVQTHATTSSPRNVSAGAPFDDYLQDRSTDYGIGTASLQDQGQKETASAAPPAGTSTRAVADKSARATATSEAQASSHRYNDGRTSGSSPRRQEPANTSMRQTHSDDDGAVTRASTHVTAEARLAAKGPASRAASAAPSKEDRLRSEGKSAGIGADGQEAADATALGDTEAGERQPPSEMNEGSMRAMVAHVVITNAGHPSVTLSAMAVQASLQAQGAPLDPQAHALLDKNMHTAKETAVALETEGDVGFWSGRSVAHNASEDETAAFVWPRHETVDPDNGEMRGHRHHRTAAGERLAEIGQDVRLQIEETGQSRHFAPLRTLDTALFTETTATDANGIETNAGRVRDALLQGLADLPTALKDGASPVAINRHLHIQLKPEHLGTVAARLTLHHGVLEIRIDLPDSAWAERVRRDAEDLARRILAREGHQGGLRHVQVHIGVDPSLAAVSRQDAQASTFGQGLAHSGHGAGTGQGQGTSDGHRQEGHDHAAAFASHAETGQSDEEASVQKGRDSRAVYL